MVDSVGAPPSPIDGAWTHADQPAINSVHGDLFPGSAPSGLDDPDTGLAAIAAHDPGFDKSRFLGDVQSTFYVVEGAWTQLDPSASRQVMSDGLWQQHRVQMQGYAAAHKHNVLEGLAVESLTVIAAHHDDNYDTITVRVLASCADYDVDDRTGKVIRGHKQPEQWMEDWTFQRSATAVTPKQGGTLSSHCPNCGAPLELDLSGVCHYCHALVSSGTFDWVLARISQVPRAVY
jgi:predicted lipid-binding transport protein (Tim44 family)